MIFEAIFRRDSSPAPVEQDVSMLADFESGAVGLSNFLTTHAGSTFENGLYRIHPVGEMCRWSTIVAEAFPSFSQRILCFASDWLGRQFALDFSRAKGGQFQILMLEPGTGQALKIPATFVEFHEQELVEYRDAALASEFYHEWLAQNGQRPTIQECVGYKTPLFLGGKDGGDNLEVTDMDVYWSVIGQLLAKVRGLPDGTRINGITLT